MLVSSFWANLCRVKTAIPKSMDKKVEAKPATDESPLNVKSPKTPPKRAARTERVREPKNFPPGNSSS
ncbi:MAG: hypothetical protein UU67_C0039G0014 [Candidatus Daviesbacteria bacterium GW2011_GWB1_41_5]|uniref:Uncharacterized protein n=1 Tax=Candidatus Daviesbacteria bacterium GW2011_GWB1_41_5 TaxID=1618429 RepID=A0A0G0ZIM4_9BACT|nr:MAG: hypothetical protein UU67_C0039G0014 [Candidatus Daviesbacteria bacterium GW2011_GWB1_41_5]